MSVEEPTFREQVKTIWNNLALFDIFFGALLGAGVGYWAYAVKAVEGTESTDLIALAGAGVGLLAATLAAIALLLGFMNGRGVDFLRERGMDEFVSPFRIVAVVTALSILASVAGAIDTSSTTMQAEPGPPLLAAILFGVAIGFFVWAVVGVTQLVKVFIMYGRGELYLGYTAAGDTAAGDTAAGDTAAGDTAAGDTAAGDTQEANADADADDEFL